MIERGPHSAILDSDSSSGTLNKLAMNAKRLYSTISRIGIFVITCSFLTKSKKVADNLARLKA